MKRRSYPLLLQLFVVVIVVLFAPQAVSAQTVDELKRNAEQGDAYAQYSLGFCYYNGKGVAKDYTEAAKWWRKSAEQGHAGAQTWLGYCYEYGQGVQQDYSEAVKWYRKAAEQGLEVAIENLKKLEQK